ncbi:MAG: twin-arginine translocase subunit TatC [Gemmatimonadota bacterium]
MTRRPRPPSHEEMPFLDHLEELRIRLLWALGAIAVGALIGVAITMELGLMELLVRPIQPYLPTGRLIFTSPTEAFLVTFKVGLFLGILLALPVVFWQFWRFVAPGLLERERRVFIPAVAGSLVLFAGGVALAFWIVIPLGLRFFLTFQSEAYQPFISVGEYLSFTMHVALAFGLVFETPLVVILLSYLGILSPRTLTRYRRHAVVAIAVLSAVFTPSPDALSMLLMFFPFFLLYEASVQVSLGIERRRERERAREARRDPAAAGPPLEPFEEESLPPMTRGG